VAPGQPPLPALPLCHARMQIRGYDEELIEDDVCCCLLLVMHIYDISAPSDR
jgi:hypothetical protein